MFKVMAYIRSKKVKGKIYYYLVEGKIVKGKVKQKVILYLGNSNHIKEVFDYYNSHQKK